MERITGMQFTGKDAVELSTERVPNIDDHIDLEAEAENFSVLPNEKGLMLHLPYEDLARIQLWKDEGGILRLAVLENKGSNWPTPREPTLEEMTKFVRVANSIMPPNDALTFTLETQVYERLNNQAKASEQRTTDLHKLAEGVLSLI
jgi:hypothetical protein